MQRTINYSGLVAPASPDEVAALRLREKRDNPGAHSRRTATVVIGTIAVVLVLITAIVTLAPTLVGTGLEASAGTNLVSLIAAIAPPLVIVTVLVVAGIVMLVLALQRSRAVWNDRVRMQRFALANELSFHVESVAPAYPGAIFGLGSPRYVNDSFRSENDRYLDFGNYTYVSGSRKNRKTHRWGFLALHLDRALPHMVLDSSANNGIFGSTNLPAVFSREQVLSLEGDFDRYFTLYCPAEYERDALYVFTPDLMALLIDEAAPYDVEIIDRWMFIYSHRHFPLADAATYQRLLRIVSTVGAKTLSQTDRYLDERVGDFSANAVAPEGRRLRRSVSWVLVAIIAVMLVVWVTRFALSLVS